MWPRVVLTMIAIVALAAPPLQAQSAPTRRGTFIDSAGLIVAAIASMDANGQAADSDPRAPQFRGNQVNSGLNAGLSSQGQLWTRFSWRASGVTGASYFPSLNQVLTTGGSGAASLSFRLGRRTNVSVSESVGYSPNYSLAAFGPSPLTGFDLATAPDVAASPDPATPAPGAGMDPGTPTAAPVTTPSVSAAVPAAIDASAVDYSVNRSPAFRSGTAVSVSRNLTSRGTLMFGYGYQRSDFLGSASFSLHASSIRSSFLYRLNRYLGFHVGYNRRFGRYGVDIADTAGLTDTDALVNTNTLANTSAIGGVDSPAGGLTSVAGRSARVDDIDFGLDSNFGRGLSLSRRMTLNFSTGGALIGDGTGRQQYAMTGAANLAYSIGRGARATIGYNRGVSLPDGFSAPLFADTIDATVQAPVGAGLSLAATSAYALGAVQTGGSGNHYGTWISSVRLSAGVTRYSALYAEYQYYQHDIGPSVDLVSSVPRAQHRQSVRAGVSARLPLVGGRRGRR